MDKETRDNLQEMRIIENNLQNILLQKQTFQIELNDFEASEEELKKTTGEVYKIVGNIMIKAKKEELEKELRDKKEMLNMRIRALEKQEDILKKKLDNLREIFEKESNKKDSRR